MPTPDNGKQPLNGIPPHILDRSLPPLIAEDPFDPSRFEPGVVIPLEIWRPKIAIPLAVLFDVDSTLFKSEALHDFGHHRLVSEVYLGLPPGTMWPRENWVKWLLSENPAPPLVADHPEMKGYHPHYRRLLTEGRCFFRSEAEVIERLHLRLLFLSKVGAGDVPPGIASRFLDPEQFKAIKAKFMVDAMTGSGPSHKLELIEGADELFRLVLEHKIPFAIGTGSPERIMKAMFAHRGWDQHVQHAITMDHLWCPERKLFRPGKPDPLTFNLAFNLITNCHPEIKDKRRVYVFEDQAKGAHSARRAGFQAFLCPDPTNGKSPEAHVEEIRKLEKDYPCPNHPPIVVAKNMSLGWKPFIGRIFAPSEESEQKGYKV